MRAWDPLKEDFERQMKESGYFLQEMGAKEGFGAREGHTYSKVFRESSGGSR